MHFGKLCLMKKFAKFSVFSQYKFYIFKHVFLLRKIVLKNVGFLIEKFSISYTKIGVFIMHFWELCLMKNTLFLKKKWRKKPLFHCVFCDFSRFLRNRKKFTSTKFLGIFKGEPCKYMGRSWADHGRSWADHGQIMGRSWAMLGFGGFSQLTAGFWWVFAAYGWVFRLACWVFLPYGWVFR